MFILQKVVCVFCKGCMFIMQNVVCLFCKSSYVYFVKGFVFIFAIVLFFLSAFSNVGSFYFKQNREIYFSFIFRCNVLIFILLCMFSYITFKFNILKFL